MAKALSREKERRTAAPVDAESYGSVAAVLERLASLGLQASQAKVYRDIQKGLLRRQSNGAFRAVDVAAYAAALRMAPGNPSRVDSVLEDLQRQKTIAEIARIEGQIRKQDLDYRLQTGELCRRSDFDFALAMRAQNFKLQLENSFRLRCVDYLRMTQEEMLEAYDRDLTAALHEYSRPVCPDDEGVPDVFALGLVPLSREEAREIEEAKQAADREDAADE